MSPNTVARRITDLAAYVEKQLLAAAKDFEAFSIALDESIDVSGTAQCVLFIRGINCSLNVTKEFLDLLPMKGTTTDSDIFQSLESCFEKHGLPWNRLICLATDGVPAMCSSNVGIVG